MLENDPNGGMWPEDFHQPSCPDCGRFDANCKCDWPMPTPPPYPADDEAKEQPDG